MYQASDKDEWVVRAAKTIEEAMELGAVGFEQFLLIDGIQLVRKRK
jgi:hypothetical protein